MKRNFTYATTLIAALTTGGLHVALAQDWNLNGNLLNTNKKLGTLNNYPLQFYTNNLERMRIDPNGKVAIGSTTPDSTFMVNGTSHFLKHVVIGTNAGPAQFLQFGTSAWMKFPQNQYIFRHSNSQEGLYSNYSLQRMEYRDLSAVPTFWMEWKTTGNSYFKGNMAIGANSALAKLDVNSVQPGMVARFNGGNGMYLGLYEYGIYRGYIGSYAGNVDDVDFGTGGGTNGKVHLTIKGVPKLTIDNTGKVGIGILTPESNLHVFRGSAGNVAPNLNAPFVVENATHNFINLLAPAASERGILFGDNLNAQDGGIVYSGTNNSLEFRTNGNITRTVLTSTGNLGIGTHTPSRKLQVQEGDIRISTNGSPARYFEFVRTASTSGYDMRFEHSSIDGGSLYVSSSRDNFSTFGDVARFDSANNDDYVFRVFGSAIASGSWNTSDIALKRDVADFTSAMDVIKKLRPRTYFFKQSNFPNLHLPSEKQYGFVAQELESVLPELVRTSKTAVQVANGERKMQEIKAVNYIELIPVLTKALQEQQQQIDELKEMVNQLMKAEPGKRSNILLHNGSLEQNTPNPLTQSTTIRYRVPSGSRSARLVITDNTGKIIRQENLGEGAGTVQVDASLMSSGIYNYSLVVDGKLIESKKMVVAR
jgi:hypothetical protein